MYDKIHYKLKIKRRVRADNNTAGVSHPTNPGVQGLSSVLRTPSFSFVSAPVPHGLTSASLTDPGLQVLLQGSSKSQVTLFCGRLGAELTSSQRDLCNPRVQGCQPSSLLGLEGPVLQMKAGACVWYVSVCVCVCVCVCACV